MAARRIAEFPVAEHEYMWKQLSTKSTQCATEKNKLKIQSNIWTFQQLAWWTKCKIDFRFTSQSLMLTFWRENWKFLASNYWMYTKCVTPLGKVRQRAESWQRQALKTLYYRKWTSGHSEKKQEWRRNDVSTWHALSTVRSNYVLV